MKSDILSSPVQLTRSPEATTQVLASPAAVKERIPRTESLSQQVLRSRQSIRAVLSGEDDSRMIVVCGPCSIHDVNAAMEYASRLTSLARRVEEELIVVMRAYFEKPRSIVGWKGFVYDPDLAGAHSTNQGINTARRLLRQINELGLPCATEFLNPLIAPYFEDLISYGAIGARTSESQIHRELASHLDLPIGMKNDLQGTLDSAINAVKAANQPHHFFSLNTDGAPCIVNSSGNPFAHVFLRGGMSGANLDALSVQSAVEGLSSSVLSRPIMLDCSHANSGKDYRNQGPNALIATDLFLDGYPEIAGLMLESNLVEGNQGFQAGKSHAYGTSITDSCIGWAETERVLLQVANRLKSQKRL